MANFIPDNMLILPPPPSGLPQPFQENMLNYIRDYAIANTKAVRQARKESRELSEDEKNKIFMDPNTKRRVVYREWPRSPDGKPMLPANSLRGKETPNGIQFWGSTIFDFYRTMRFCDIPGLSTISTGSKLLAWMKENEETEMCKDEMDWAKDEDFPHILPVYDHAKLILEDEERIRKGEIGKTMSDEDKARWGFNDPRFKDTEFDLEKYPAPWPIEPFSYEPTTLCERLLLSRLPEKLFVHATRKALQTDFKPPKYSNSSNADNKGTDDPSKPEEPDVVHEYKLCICSAGNKRLEKHREEEKRRQKAREETKYSFRLVDPDQITELDPVEPIVSAVHPHPPLPTHTPEVAHLHISTDHLSGRGNHSVVYQAQLDLPRDTLVPEALCRECVLESVHKKIEAQDGPKGETKADIWKEKSGMWKKKLVSKGIETQIDFTKDGKIEHIVKYGEVKDEWTYEYEGPLREIEAETELQNPIRGRQYCPHLTSKDFSKHPHTARVKLVAKLSKQHDNHLHLEARNYQQFPEHLFEHWNGYNLVSPLYDPVPVNAAVPQFYGYYEPVKKEGDHRWLSPIMLLEDCGSQFSVSSTGISLDDTNEAVSLLYRMHEAEWAHGSVYARNFVRQPGPLWKHPSERGKAGGATGLDSEYSYRLIDFGRSEKVSTRGGHDARMLHGSIRHDIFLLDRVYKLLFR